MNNFEKALGEIFDVSVPEVLPAVKKANLPAVIAGTPDLEEDLSDAYEQTKTNLQDLLDQGKDAMDEILLIAKAGQHPRAFEVYGTIFKNMVDANKELLAVQKQMRDMDKKQEVGGTTIDKAIFVGSTKELSELIKGNR